MVLTTSAGLMIVFALSKRLAWELNLIIKDAKLCVADAMTTVGCAFWDTPTSCLLAVGVDVRCYYVYNFRNGVIQVFLQSQTGLNNITMLCWGHRYCLCASVGWVYVLERRQGLWSFPPLHTSCSLLNDFSGRWELAPNTSEVGVCAVDVIGASEFKFGLLWSCFNHVCARHPKDIWTGAV